MTTEQLDKQLEANRKHRAKQRAVRTMKRALWRVNRQPPEQIKRKILDMAKRGKSAADIVIVLAIPASVVVQVIREHSEANVKPIEI